MKPTSSISNTFLFSLLIVIVLTGGSIGYSWIHSETLDFEESLQLAEKRFLEQQKAIIRAEVDNVIEYMLFKENENIQDKRNQLKKQTDEAYKLIQYIYEGQLKNTDKRRKIKKIVSFFDKNRQTEGSQHYIIQQIGGKRLFDEQNPEHEGKNLYDVTDEHGQFFIRQMDKLALEKGESTISFSSRSEKSGNLQDVMAYLRYFKPLDIYIVSGAVLDTSVKESKKEVMKWAEKVHFSTTGYLFILDYEKNIVMHPYSGELDKNKSEWQEKNPLLLDSLVVGSRRKEGAFLQYNYPLPGHKEFEPKLVYAKNFEKWQWTIVGGVYLNTFDKEIAAQREDFKHRQSSKLRGILGIISFFVFISAIVAFLLSRTVRGNLLIFHRFFSEAFLKGKKIDPDKLAFNDFKELSSAANDMIEKHIQSKKALEKSEARLTSAIEKLPFPLIITNELHSPVYLNRVFTSTFGYELNDFVSNVEFFRAFFPDENYRKLVVTNWERTAEEVFRTNKAAQRQEWVVTCKDGNKKEVYFEFVPMGNQLLLAMTDVSVSKESEQKLWETLVQLNAILENSPSMITSIRKDGKIIYVNRSIQGIPLSKLKGGDFFDFFPRSMQRILRPAFQKVYATEETHKFDYQDTKNNWWETLLIPIKNSSNIIEQIIAISNDITVRKWAEKALQEREGRFKELSDATFEGILILKENKIIEANSIASEIFGYTPTELVGGHIRKLLELDERAKKEIEQKKDTTECTEILGYKKNGERIYCEVRTKFSLYNGQQVNVTAIRNVTSRVETQEALDHTEALLNTANQRSPIGIIIADTYKSRIQMANDAAAEVLGLNKGDELVNTNYSEQSPDWRFLHYDGKEMQIEDMPLTRSSKGELVKNMKAIVRRADGTYRWLLINSAPIKNPQGFITAAVMTFPDITELKQTEQRLIEAKEKAEEADKLKSAFLANMSHEIRTPMNAIIGFSDMLIDDSSSDEERNEYISYIIENGKSLLALIDDIIDISKIEAKQIDIQPIEFDLINFFKELDAVFKAEMKRLGKSHISLALEIEDERKSKLFLTDSQRLKQVFSNLLSNAIKFTDSGIVSFGYRTLSNRIYFFVKDTGIGIPKEKQTEIFNRFTKLNSTKNRLFGGTGLGLAISKRLVELLGGEIGLNSQIGKGSLFYFSLPTKSESEADISNVKITKPKNQKIDLSGKRILIAEDEEANYKLIKAVFKKENVQLVRAKNGYEVIHFLENTNDIVDIILMDIKMPVMDGYETIKILKERFSDIPVIAQTALAMSNDRSRIINAGFNDYIAKPLKKHDLLEKIGLYI